MILAHALVGIIGGTYANDLPYVFVGSVLPDIDHLYIIARHKMYPPKKLIHSLRFEGRYGNLKYKTKYVHSVFGALLFSAPIMLWNPLGAKHFFFAYLGHLLLDWVDHDEKEYLFPLKKKFRGFLPIFSKLEIAFTLALFIFMIVILKKA
ncbi:MAG TPA: metal-dependent hydrolase [Patescibacteria group bacterium]